MNLARLTPKRAYFIGARGWLDLIGSIPSLGFFQLTALLRLARLSRLTRITRLLGGQAGKELVLDVLRNRSQYATFITILLAGMVLSIASILILHEESRSPDANITTGGDALWWGIVTITTVGYGDYYPVTTLGRITAVFVMFAGIGIIGALASILASVLVAPTDAEGTAPEAVRRQRRPRHRARSRVIGPGRRLHDRVDRRRAGRPSGRDGAAAGGDRGLAVGARIGEQLTARTRAGDSLPGFVVCLVVVLHDRGSGDGLRALRRAALILFALLDVLVHPLLFRAHAGQMFLLRHRRRPYLSRIRSALLSIFFFSLAVRLPFLTC